MLLKRIPLRIAAAVGATVIATGAASGVVAFASSGADPSAAANEAGGAGGDGGQFFTDEVSEEDLAAAASEAEGTREEAVQGGSAGGSDSVSEEEEEEAELPDVPDGSAREIAQGMLSDYGWGGDQFSCLDPLWERESGWNHTAQNPSSGAYGIPQALPGDKMASAGSDWQTNPATQIRWGLGYIEDRYGSPCAAWEHSEANGWY